MLEIASAAKLPAATKLPVLLILVNLPAVTVSLSCKLLLFPVGRNLSTPPNTLILLILSKTPALFNTDPMLSMSLIADKLVPAKLGITSLAPCSILLDALSKIDPLITFVAICSKTGLCTKS